MTKGLTIVADGTVTLPEGFQAAGIACGIKGGDALDLALVYSPTPCVAAATFTTNLFKAAPVIYDQNTLRHNRTHLHGVVINSGCANACTGEPGLADARDMAGHAATALGCARSEMLVMSTGVIGQRLPMQKIAQGVRWAATQLGRGREAGLAAAQAIMTTDTRPKTLGVRVEGEGWSFSFGGMAKGAGMIHPNMATLLGVLTTDAHIEPALAQQALRQIVERTFNMITIDGDTSTNDTILLLANGQAGLPRIEDERSKAYEAFREGLYTLALELAKGIVRDGEGATKFVTITVRGAQTRDEAKQVAMAVATSSLVKTAIYGEDANWGRIVCAVGYSGVPLNPDKVDVWLGGLQLVRAGAPYQIDEARAAQILAQRDIEIIIDLHLGDKVATVYTSDLSHAYVDINAHYRT